MPGIARIDTARAGRAEQRRCSKAQAAAEEALAVDGLMTELVAIVDRVAAVRDAGGIVLDQSVPFHTQLGPVYGKVEALGRMLRTHWRPVVLPAARQLAGPADRGA